MIDKEKIEKSIREYIRGTGIFLVAVRVSSLNRITVLADSNKGITINECALLHRHIEQSLDREAEDYELQVSSPGLGMPLGVIEQFYKNEGSKVAVLDKEGQKYYGRLKNVTDGGFELESEIKVSGKTKEVKDISFNFDQIKSTKVVLTLK